MDNGLLIIINNESLDFSKDDIVFNYKVSSFFSETEAGFSNNLKIKNNAKNSRLLGYPYFINQDETQNKGYKNSPCILKIGSKFIECIIYILDVNNDEISICLIENKINLLKLMSEKSVNELDLIKYGIYRPDNNIDNVGFLWTLEELRNYKENSNANLNNYFIFPECNFGNYPDAGTSQAEEYCQILYMRPFYSVFELLKASLHGVAIQTKPINNIEEQNKDSLNPDYQYLDIYGNSSNSKGKRFNLELLTFENIIYGNDANFENKINELKDFYLMADVLYPYNTIGNNEDVRTSTAPSTDVDFNNNNNPHYTDYTYFDKPQMSSATMLIDISYILRKSKKEDSLEFELYKEDSQGSKQLIYRDTYAVGDNGEKSFFGSVEFIELLPDDKFCYRLKCYRNGTTNQGFSCYGPTLDFKLQNTENVIPGNKINLIKSLPNITILDLFITFLKHFGLGYYIANNTVYLYFINDFLRFSEKQKNNIKIRKNIKYSYRSELFYQNNRLFYNIPTEIETKYKENKLINSFYSVNNQIFNESLPKYGDLIDLQNFITIQNIEDFATFPTNIIDRLGYFNYKSNSVDNQQPPLLSDKDLSVNFSSYSPCYIKQKIKENNDGVGSDFKIIYIDGDYNENENTKYTPSVINGVESIDINKINNVYFGRYFNLLKYPVFSEMEILINEFDFQNINPFTKIADETTGAIYSIIELRNIKYENAYIVATAICLRIN